MAEEYTYGVLKCTLRDSVTEGDPTKYVKKAEYIGPTGPGSEAHLSIRFPDKVIMFPDEFRNAINGINVEKIVFENSTFSLENMPILQEVVIMEDWLWSFVLNRTCPQVRLIDIRGSIREPVAIQGKRDNLTIIYSKDIEELEHEVAGDGIHAVFGDEVVNVGFIRGGHVTLGKGVKQISALKKADMGLAADTTVAEYELPTRIDILSAEPPTVGSVAPGAMTVAELHVPAGALDAYMGHPQWGKAAYFVEEGGKTVDNYAAKHKARLKKLKKESEAAATAAAEKAKTEKVKAIGGMAHSVIGPQKLSKWKILEQKDWSNSLEFTLAVDCLELKLSVPKDAPLDIWDKIVASLDNLDSQLK